MIQINSSALMILKSCIGKKLYAIFSDSISFSEFEISFNNRELRISFFKGCSFEVKSEFFETDDGEMFHSYVIKENEPYREGLSGYTLNSDVIKKIEIYGRPFPIEAFKSYADIYSEFKGIDKTDDLFMFYPATGGRIMIVMHDFMPEINLFIGDKMINWFFENTRSEYSLHHTI